VTHRFGVFVNGTKVGELSFVTEATTGEDARVLKGTFVTAPIAPTVTGLVTVRIESLTTVCFGGGSWAWKTGGGLVMQ
jgi:hypothetical protein